MRVDRSGVINVKSKNLKLIAATAGAGAMLSMGALTVATSQAEPAPPGPVEPTEVTTGETTTETTAPLTPTTTIATPTIEGPATLPSEQEDAL
ncbi:MAG: hypothetical protein ABW137_33590 [Mycobacterium sp.]